MLLLNHQRNRFTIGIFLAIFLHLVFFLSYLKNSFNSEISANEVGNLLSINISKFISTNNKKSQNSVLKNQPIKEAKKTNINDSTNLTKKINDLTDQDLPISSSFSTKGQRQMPQYPSRALRLKQEGTVYLKILLSENGEIEKIAFIEKSAYPLLNQAAIDAVKKWQFNPAIIDGKYSKSWIEVPIEFKIKY